MQILWIGLGSACVGWTLFEWGRLAATSSRPGPARRAGSPPRPFAAWDDHGQAIEVEDLGPLR